MAQALPVHKIKRKAVPTYPIRHHLFICPQKWMALKDCRFYDHGLTVEVWQNEILVRDIRHRDTIKLPEAGSSVQWSFVRLRSFGQRRLIEIQFWAKPDAVTGIQTQKWVVYEWHNGHLKKDLELNLQRRKRLADGRLLSDPPVPHSLSRGQVGIIRKIVWHCGRRYGSLGAF